MEGLVMGTHTWWVGWGRSQCSTLRVKGSDVITTCSYRCHSYVWIGDVGPLTGTTSLMSPHSCNPPATSGGVHWGPAHTPLYICSVMSSTSPSVDPRRVLTEACAGAIILACSFGWAWAHLQLVPSLSFCLMAAALWSRHSSNKSPHSWQWVVLQPRCSLLSSTRNNWLWRAQSCHPFWAASSLSIMFCSFT